MTVGHPPGTSSIFRTRWVKGPIMVVQSSIEIRNLVVRLYMRLNSLRQTSRLTDVPKSTVARWVASHPAARHERRNRHRVKCTDDVRRAIATVLDRNAFSTSASVAHAVREQLGIRLGHSTVRHHVRQMGFTRKKPCTVPDSTRVTELRHAFAQVHVHRQCDDIISVDETAIFYHTTPSVGYARRGARIARQLHTHHRHRATLIMAVTTTGIAHWQLLQGSTTASRFADFINSPQIRALPQSTLLLDNAAFHKTASVASAAAAVGKTIAFLSPYSPHFQPIEHVFSVLKQRLSYMAPTAQGFCIGDLTARLAKALESLPQDMRPTFASCARRVQAASENLPAAGQ